MGEIAEMMIDGTLCEGCGVALDGDSPGYPRRCASCRKEQRAENHQATLARQQQVKKVPCQTCGKKVKGIGLADHQRDAHGVAPTSLALPRRGLVVLKNVIQLLREEARFVDEEGDDTNALEELLEALCTAGVALPAPLGWWTDELEKIFTATEGSPITADMKRAAHMALTVARGGRWDDEKQEWTHGVNGPAAPKRWPFVETPGEFTQRLHAALGLFDNNLLAAVRYVLIETPPTLSDGVDLPDGGQRG